MGVTARASYEVCVAVPLFFRILCVWCSQQTFKQSCETRLRASVGHRSMCIDALGTVCCSGVRMGCPRS